MSLKQIHDQLLRVTECSIHLGPMQDPRVLPCGHSYCLHCLLQCREPGKSGIQCPIDRTNHKLDNVRNLPVNYAVLDWLALVGEIRNQQMDVIAEVENAKSCLQLTEQTCDVMIDQLQKTINSIRELKSNLACKQKSLDAFYVQAQMGNNEERKDHAMVCVVYSSNIVQKYCTKLTAPVMEQLNQSLSTVQQLAHTAQVLDMVDFNLKPDKPMAEGKVCQTIIAVTDAVLREAHFIDSPKKMAERIVVDVKLKFGNHLWTVLTGKTDLRLSIMCSDDDYLSLVMGNNKFVVYRSNPTTKIYSKTKKSLEIFVQNELQLLHKQRLRNPQIHIEKVLKENLIKKFGGEWHTISYKRDTGGIHCSGSLVNFVELMVEERIYCTFQCIDI